MSILKQLTKLQLLLLFFIVAIAFLLGSRIILAGDFLLLYDQARDLLLAKSIAYDHKLMLIGSQSGIGGFYHGPFYIYLLVPFILLGGGNPFTVTFLFMAIGVATVLAGFYVGYKLYGKTAGFLAAFFLAISPQIWGYVASTQGINLVPLLYLGLFYFIILYLRGRRTMFIPAAFLTGFAFQFEMATALVLVPMVASIYFFLPKAYKRWKIVVASFGVFVMSLSTFILFDLRHQFLSAHSVLNYIFGGSGNNGFMPLPYRLLSHGDAMLNVYSAALIKNDLIMKLLLLTVFIAASLAVLKKGTRQLKKEYFLLLLFPLITFLMLLFYPHTIYAQYVLGLTVPVVLFMSIGMEKLWQQADWKFLAGFFMLILGIQVLIQLYAGYSIPHRTNNAGTFQAQKAVVDWIYRDARQQKFGYMVYTPETFTTGMDYLFWWSGTKLYGYAPTNQKQPVTYLIMYPPLKGDNGAHDFWKKSVVRTKGKVIAEKTINTIVVQKIQVPADDPPADPNYYQNLIFR